jgi:hypothetical protein
MTHQPLPRCYSKGSYSSFTPILPRASLPTLLSFLEDIGCLPEHALSLSGDLHLQQKDGRFICVPEELLNWIQVLQPDSYPVPELSLPVYSDKAIQTEKDTPEKLLGIRDLTRFAKELYLAAGQPPPILDLRLEGGLKVGKVRVEGKVVAEWRSIDAKEVSIRAMLAAARCIDANLTELWLQRNGSPQV